MLESAQVGHRVAKAAFDRAERRLREQLLVAQFALKAAGRGPVLLLLCGHEAGGRAQTLHRLTGWMDPRFIRAVAFDAPTAEERAHPPAWRYWTALPPKGRLGIFIDAWYARPLAMQLDDDADRIDASLAALRDHEQMLADEGYRLVKVWLHLGKRELKQRIEVLERDGVAPRRVIRDAREAHARHASDVRLFEHVLQASSTSFAPWTVVEALDDNYRDLAVGRLVLAAMSDAAANAVPAHRAAPVATATIDNRKLLRDLDLSQCLDERSYDDALAACQRRLAALTRRKRFRKRSLVLVFEGMDAAGKGGAVRRVTAALDARDYAVIPVGAPNDDERAHPYLWRFWRCVPRRGGIAIFDRSWYGRVLVERVEGLAADVDWLRAYDEINRFEAQLADAGAIIVKLWLHVSRREQLRRFRARETTPFKQFKISADDWRNRRNWKAYEQAVCDMVDRTSTSEAPWTLVEADDKRFARVKVLRTIVERLEAALDA